MVTTSMAAVVRDMTLDVTLTGVRTWNARCTVGVWLIKLAAWVMGCNVQVELERSTIERRTS